MKDNRPEIGVSLVLFDAEDYGSSGNSWTYCKGSQYFAKNLPIPFPASWELFQLSATHGEEIARLQTLSNDVEHSDCLREYAELSNRILTFFDFNPSSTNNNELTSIQIAQAGFQPDSRHATGGSRVSARNNFFEYDAANNGIIEFLQNNENLNQELISQNSDFISQLEGLGVRRIRIDNDVVVSGIPSIVADFNIGQAPGSNLVSMWLAWRSENQRGGAVSYTHLTLPTKA